MLTFYTRVFGLIKCRLKTVQRFSFKTIADKRAEWGVREESETTADPAADGSHQKHETEEENGPDEPDYDRGIAVVPGHGIPAGHTGLAERHTGKVFLPDVLQLVRRTNGHAGAAERVAELRVLLLHE